MFVHDIRIPLKYNDSHNLFCSINVNMYDICNIIECYICITDVYHLYLYLHFQNIAFLNKGFTCNIQDKLIFKNQNCSFFTFHWDRGGILYTCYNSYIDMVISHILPLIHISALDLFSSNQIQYRPEGYDCIVV